MRDVYDVYIDFSSIFLDILSTLLGADLRALKKAFDKKSEKSNSLEISENINAVSKKLSESKEIIENALLEIDKQKELFEKMKKEAEISQQVTSMNQDQVNALNQLIEGTLNKQEKKSSRKNILLNLFFSVLGAVLGFILGKVFP